MASPKIPARTLTTFAEDNLRLIYSATTQKAFDAAFESLFSKHLEVTLNGQKSTRAHFKSMLWNEKHGERRGTVAFAGSVQASAGGERPEDVNSRCRTQHPMMDSHYVSASLGWNRWTVPERCLVARARWTPGPRAHHGVLQTHVRVHIPHCCEKAAEYRHSIIQDKSAEPGQGGEHPPPGDFEIRRASVVDIVVEVETVQ